MRDLQRTAHPPYPRTAHAWALLWLVVAFLAWSTTGQVSFDLVDVLFDSRFLLDLGLVIVLGTVLVLAAQLVAAGLARARPLRPHPILIGFLAALTVGAAAVTVGSAWSGQL